MSPIKVGGRVINGSATSNPSNPVEGDTYWFSTDNKYRVYDGTDWKNIDVSSTAPAGTETDPARSAKALLDSGQTTDGVYWLDMHGGYSSGNAKKHYCLMDSNYDGGGWTMLAAMNHGNDFKSGTNYTFGVDVGSPSSASDFLASDWGYDRKNTFTPADSDQFMIRRSDTNAWVRFVVGTNGWSPTENSEGSGWETLKSTDGSDQGHQFYAEGQTYDSSGNAISNAIYFNGCSHGGNCASGGGDASGFGTHKAWSANHSGEKVWGGGYNSVNAGGSPLCWENSWLTQDSTTYIQYFYRKAGTQ
jgi:hypothetical protein